MNGINAWKSSSIMAALGISAQAPGKEHHVTTTEQGNYQYVYGHFAAPILTVDPGDVLVIDTEDAFDGKIKSEQDQPTQKQNHPYYNPQSGPISIRRAVKGDCLAVSIDSVDNRTGHGITALYPDFGGLVGTDATAMLHPPLPERVKIMAVAKGRVHFNEKIALPYQPFIGSIGVSPEIEAISALVPDYYGGNMDLPDVAPGAIIYFPVQTAGAHLFLGDCHATQGDGELTGVAVEQAATVTLKVDVIKGWSLAWPRLETEDCIMAIGSARPMEDAARIAYKELCRWMATDYGFDEIEAYMLLGQAGRIRLGNMVDPKYTIGASIRKEYLVS